MPICGQDDRLNGMISDRDIVRRIPQEKTGEMVGAIAAAPPEHF
jgi:hypothetical protein